MKDLLSILYEEVKVIKKLVKIPNALFILILLIQFVPNKRIESDNWSLFILIGIIEVFYLISIIFQKNRNNLETKGDIISILYVISIIWQVLTTKLNLLNKTLYPSPEAIIKLFISDFPQLVTGLISSLELLLEGYILALLLAIPLALFIGWRKRLYRAVNPITKVLGPIPPIVYVPYAIALLPTFKGASIFIIFIGVFWPVFINTLSGVFNVESSIIDSAKVLKVNERTMLFKIILPAALPSILNGATLGLVMAFILLTAAEMIGATSGLGWYVKYFSDFADYPRVIVGIIFIGFVVTILTFALDKLEKWLLRWKR